MGFFGWRPYVPVAQRQRQAQKKIAAMKKKGEPVAPVTIEGRVIAKSFWGKSWCDNLERYSDYENRLPRGRTYVRNGSVIDLRIAKGEVAALVVGSDLYQVKATIAPVTGTRWKAICRDCAGSIDSLVELLQGRFAKGVMDRVCRKGDGLFPAPSEIALSCSCPDWADMCKHIAAVLYGVGARLDQKPELLFMLCGVDQSELLARAGAGLSLARPKPKGPKALGDDDLAAVFGLDMADAPDPAAAAGIVDAPTPAASRRSRRRGTAGNGAANAAKPGQSPGRATGEARANGGRKAGAYETLKPPAKPARTASAAPKATSRPTTPGKPVAVPTRKAPVATTKITPDLQKTPVAKAPAKAPRKPAAKIAAGRASGASRKTQAKPEPKWATLARARRERTRRKGR
jgi:uncharacterized Zn finger protein